MRRLILIATMFLMASAASAGELSKYAKDSLDGFRGYLWGTPIAVMDSVFDLIPIADSSEGKRETAYKLIIDRVGEAEVDKCLLGFYNGRFCSVTIYTKGWDNWHRLYLAARERYAKRALITGRINNEEQPNEYIDEYYWNSARTTRMCKRNPITDDGELLLYSEVLSKEALKADKEAAKEAKGDL